MKMTELLPLKVLSFTFRIFFISTATEVANCGLNKFMCRNHQECIDRQLRCDVQPDCKDGSDEDNCSMLYNFIYST